MSESPNYEWFQEQIRQMYSQGFISKENTFRNFYNEYDRQNFQYTTSYDTSARKSFDYEIEAIDINEPEYTPQYRWFNNRPMMTFCYQYMPFDEWFTLFECTAEFLYQVCRRQDKGMIESIAHEIRPQLEKRFFKVERLY